MSNELKPPTNQEEALQLIEPLDPRPTNNATLLDKYLAFERLQEFIRLLFPSK